MLFASRPQVLLENHLQSGESVSPSKDLHRAVESHSRKAYITFFGPYYRHLGLQLMLLPPHSHNKIPRSPSLSQGADEKKVVKSTK